MATIADVYMGWVRTSPTTLNKPYSLVSSQAGVRGELGLISTGDAKCNMTGRRCTAPSSDLDGSLAGRRSHEHTECAIDACTLQDLWNNYGIVGDLIVRC